MDPNNLICMGWKWRHGDVSKHTNGNLKEALERIKAITYVVGFTYDMAFPISDCEHEQKMISNSKLFAIDTLWAHFGMFCVTDNETNQIDKILAELLNEEA